MISSISCYPRIEGSVCNKYVHELIRHLICNQKIHEQTQVNHNVLPTEVNDDVYSV